MANTGFAERLASVRWTLSRGKINPLSDREFAAALGVGYKWLGKWKASPSAPNGRAEMIAIEKALEPIGVSVKWLYDGKGTAPRLWRDWLATESVAQLIPEERGGKVVSAATAKKKAR